MYRDLSFHWPFGYLLISGVPAAMKGVSRRDEGRVYLPLKASSIVSTSSSFSLTDSLSSDTSRLDRRSRGSGEALEFFSLQNTLHRGR